MALANTRITTIMPVRRTFFTLEIYFPTQWQQMTTMSAPRWNSHGAEPLLMRNVEF